MKRLFIPFALVALLLAPVGCTAPGVNTDGTATTQSQQTVAAQYSTYLAGATGWAAFLAAQKAGDPAAIAIIGDVEPKRKAARAAIDRAAAVPPGKPDPAATAAASAALQAFLGALARHKIAQGGA